MGQTICASIATRVVYLLLLQIDWRAGPERAATYITEWTYVFSKLNPRFCHAMLYNRLKPDKGSTCHKRGEGNANAQALGIADPGRLFLPKCLKLYGEFARLASRII